MPPTGNIPQSCCVGPTHIAGPGPTTAPAPAPNNPCATTPAHPPCQAWAVAHQAAPTPGPQSPSCQGQCTTHQWPCATKHARAHTCTVWTTTQKHSTDSAQHRGLSATCHVTRTVFQGPVKHWLLMATLSWTFRLATLQLQSATGSCYSTQKEGRGQKAPSSTPHTHLLRTVRVLRRSCRGESPE